MPSTNTLAYLVQPAVAKKNSFMVLKPGGEKKTFFWKKISTKK
jgi:hypothetical protein